MPSETCHSISETGNQVVLLIGIRGGATEPSRGHPFGDGRAQLLYGVLVTVLLFGVAR
jgi:divalent metal cation (Fe/Co/Zn/Cd) transporter